MAILKIPRINTLTRSNLILQAAEMVFDTEDNIFYGGDGTTIGGVPLTISDQNPDAVILETFNINQTVLSEQGFDLLFKPRLSSVQFMPRGGIMQIRGVDFGIVDNSVVFTGFTLESFFENGDIIDLFYQVAE